MIITPGEDDDLKTSIITAARRHLQEFIAERTKVCRGKGIGPVHRMRVASRRLRVALQVLEGGLPDKKCRKWRKKVRFFGRALGAARELDVQRRFFRQLRRSAAAVRYADGIDLIGEYLTSERRKVQKRLTRLFKKDGFCGSIAGIDTYLKKRLAAEYADTAESFNGRVSCFARAQLKELLLLEPVILRPGNEKLLHGMRIAAKKLRYTLELLGSPRQKLARYIRAVTDVQDILGDIHEMDVMAACLDSVPLTGKHGKKISAAAAFAAGECRLLRERMFRRFTARWNNLRKEKIWPQLRETL